MVGLGPAKGELIPGLAVKDCKTVAIPDFEINPLILDLIRAINYDMISQFLHLQHKHGLRTPDLTVEVRSFSV